ncbi:MAG: hypothetical protein AAGM46_20615 [Cyanobacteria bacterium J06582_2]
MKIYNWKRIIGIGLSVFALFIGSASLTGCEVGGEGEEIEEGELEEEGEEIEGEEIEEEDDD